MHRPINKLSVGDTPVQLTLAEAITHLETGSIPAEALIDLGDGVYLAVGDIEDQAGLSQRLRGHRMLWAIASGQVSPTRRNTGEEISILPEMKTLLDAMGDAS